MSLLMPLHQQRQWERAQRVLQMQPSRSPRQHPGLGVAPASARGERPPRQHRRVLVRHIQSGFFQGIPTTQDPTQAPEQMCLLASTGGLQAGKFGRVSCMLKGNACASTRGGLTPHTQVITIWHNKQTV